LLTEKHFLIRKFFLGLGTQTQKIFEQAESECQRWMEDVLGILKTQMTEHKNSLDQRTKNLTEARESAEALDAQLALVEQEYASVAKESQVLDTMLLQLIKAVKPAMKAKAIVEVEAALDKSIQLPEMPFLNVTANPAS
jgi:archaellum component FlaC